MDFSNDSETIMTFLMKNFKTFHKKRNPEEQSNFDTIVTKFYNNMKEAHNRVLILWNINKIKKEVRELPGSNKLSHNKLLNSSYVPEGIKRYIFNNTKGEIKYSGVIRGRNITIHLYLMNNRQFNELGKIDTQVRRMFTWLYFIIPYSNRDCSKSLTVTCYLCPHKKLLPKTQFTTMGSHHVNSGVSSACPTNGDICIYRREELFKVFIHETFHAFGLDWSNMIGSTLSDKLRKLFPISSDMNVSETYTEFWASIFNCLFTAFYLRDNKDNKEEFLLYAEYCIHFEQIFSLFQSAKILQFMGIYYNTLYESDDLSVKARKFLYKERSNIFAYYILKMILLLNVDQFMAWCKGHNKNILNFTKTEQNLSSFYNFIEKHYNCNVLISNLDKMHKIIKGYKKNKDNSIVSKTLRMTVIELV